MARAQTPFEMCEIARQIAARFDGTKAKLILRDGEVQVGAVTKVSPVNASIRLGSTVYETAALTRVEVA